MSTIRFLLIAASLLAGMAGPGARAAESYDNCTGFVDTVPATISTQGTWCLRQDLSTAITGGNAITVANHNVTLNCNGFKLGGLAAGSNSGANGIYAANRNNITVRNCNVRGFWRGVSLEGGRGQLVEDNRLDGNLYIGIQVTGGGSRVMRNAVHDTGGSPLPQFFYGIYAAAQVLDNTVAGVSSRPGASWAIGIYIYGEGNEAGRNRVRGLVPDDGVTSEFGIQGGAGVTIDGNHIAQATATLGHGVHGDGLFCGRNTVANFSTPYVGCTATLGNLALP